MWSPAVLSRFKSGLHIAEERFSYLNTTIIHTATMGKFPQVYIIISLYSNLCFCLRGCPRSFLQTSIFNVQPHAQKDHNSNEIFVMGPAHCAGPMTKISLLLWSFCARNLSLKIDVCKKLLGHPHRTYNVYCPYRFPWKCICFVLCSLVVRLCSK